MRTLAARVPLTVVDAALGALALWQAWALLCVYAGWSTDVLFWGSPFALLGLGLPDLLKPWQPDPTEPPQGGTRGQMPPAWASGLGMACAAIGAVGFTLGDWPVLVASLWFVPLAAAQVSPRAPLLHGSDPPEGTASSPLDTAGLAVAVVAAVGLTLALQRPNVDDAYYLNAILEHLARPDAPVQTFDGIHGDPTAPIQQVAHRPQTYEPLVAVLTRGTGIAPRTAYWFVLPALAAAFGSVAHHALFKAVAPRLAWLATPLVVPLVLLWGDGPQAYGRFAYVRMFQGKSIFVLAMAPLILYAAFRFVRAPSWRSWVRLMAAQLAGSIFTSTALVVGPVAAGVALLAGLQPDRRHLRWLAVGLLASAPMVAVLGLTFLEIQQAGGLGNTGNYQGFRTVLGSWRGGPALAALVFAPWLLRLRQAPGADWLGRYALITLVLLFSGLAPRLLGDSAAALLNWRTLWAVPLYAFVALAGAAGAVGIVQGVRRGHRIAVASGALGVLLVMLFGPGKTTWDVATWRWMAPKVRPGVEKTARRVVALTSPDDMVLAHPEVAWHIAMIEDHPALVGVWNRYIHNLERHWGSARTSQRLRSMDFVRDRTFHVPGAALQALCVRVVVLGVEHRRHSMSAYGLEGLSFERVVAGRFDIWARSPDDLPPHCSE